MNMYTTTSGTGAGDEPTSGLGRGYQFKARAILVKQEIDGKVEYLVEYQSKDEAGMICETVTRPTPTPALIQSVEGFFEELERLEREVEQKRKEDEEKLAMLKDKKRELEDEIADLELKVRKPKMIDPEQRVGAEKMPQPRPPGVHGVSSPFSIPFGFEGRHSTGRAPTTSFGSFLETQPSSGGPRLDSSFGGHSVGNGAEAPTFQSGSTFGFGSEPVQNAFALPSQFVSLYGSGGNTSPNTATAAPPFGSMFGSNSNSFPNTARTSTPPPFGSRPTGVGFSVRMSKPLLPPREPLSDLELFFKDGRLNSNSIEIITSPETAEELWKLWEDPEIQERYKLLAEEEKKRCLQEWDQYRKQKRDFGGGNSGTEAAF